jgi:hypothetical protein
MADLTAAEIASKSVWQPVFPWRFRELTEGLA